MICEKCKDVKSCFAREKIIDPTQCNFFLLADNKNAKVITLKSYPPNTMEHWTEYRWAEGILCLTNHPEYADFMSLQVVSKRLSDFYWLQIWLIKAAI